MTTHENSTESYETYKAESKPECFRRQIFELLCDTDMTDRQMMNALKVFDFNNIRPEITRLKQDGLVEEIGKTHCAVTGRKVRICRAVPGAIYFTHNETKSKSRDLFKHTARSN